MTSDSHNFACHLVWTGAARGGTDRAGVYSRDLRIDMEGKPSLVASAAPGFHGDPSLHNPEDLLVAAVSACHCLSYLAVCANAGVQVIGYEDAASGTLAKVDRVMRFTEVVLRPTVTITEDSSAEKAKALHDKAHAICFIANSVSFPVRYEPRIEVSPPRGQSAG